MDNIDRCSQPPFERVNQDPYGAGWLIVIAISNPKELDGLMTAAQYEEYLQTAGGH